MSKLNDEQRAALAAHRKAWREWERAMDVVCETKRAPDEREELSNALSRARAMCWETGRAPGALAMMALDEAEAEAELAALRPQEWLTSGTIGDGRGGREEFVIPVAVLPLPPGYQIPLCSTCNRNAATVMVVSMSVHGPQPSPMCNDCRPISWPASVKAKKED